MKRKLALLLLLLLVATVLLAACNQPEATTADVRWYKEKHVFRITLADIRIGENNSMYFATYDEKGELTSNSKSSYRKDKAIAGESLASKDEVMPVKVDGTYTLTIDTKSDATGRCVVTGEQVLYLQYMLQSTVQGETVDLTEWQELDLVKAPSEEIPAGLVNDDKNIVLKSTTTTVVEFINQTQQPISSSTNVVGFYIGKAHRQVTKYDVSTTYNFKEKKPTATVTVGNEEPVTYELKSSSNVKLIDSNQILMYVRSLSKTEGSLQDNHSAYVFDPLTGKTQAASFNGYTYQDRVILTNPDVDPEQKLFTTVNSVAVTIGGNAFMQQDNVPQTVKEDQTTISTVTRAKLTTIHFRVGYLSYEIEYSNEENIVDWSAIWQALTPKVEEPQGE
ncbi:MAG: hypothetical protein J1F65_03835 [Clostridiales bacterium]|nr:hypothetical protein [Clostridiales bacterium]